MLKKFNELLRWIDGKPNKISALGHGLVCVGWMTVGLAFSGLSLLADDTLAIPILTFFAGMCIGGYGLRETDDTRKGQPLHHGYEDFMGALVFTIAISMIYAGIVT